MGASLPGELTIIVAKYVVLVAAVGAAAFVASVLWSKPERRVSWAVTIGFTSVGAYLFAVIGATLYHDPRPFVVDHFIPLIKHVPDNGFPSDHALLAALIAAAVCILNWRAGLVFVFFALIIDWARVGAGLHHTQDVVGSTVMVAIALAISLWLTRLVSPHVERLGFVKRFQP